MRRLNRDDDGITAVVVTSGMTVFILMAALALDMGTGFFNGHALRTARTLRALAAAINCATGKPIDTTPLPALKTATSAPARHQTVALDISMPAPGTTKSQLRSPSPGLPVHAGIRDTQAQATAKWGTIGGRQRRLPLAIAALRVLPRRILDGDRTTSRSIWTTRSRRAVATRSPVGSANCESGDTTCTHRARRQWRCTGQARW